MSRRRTSKRRTFGRRTCLALATTLLGVLATGCVAPPHGLQLDPGPLAVDHSIWDALLREHVADGVVDYPSLCRAPALRSYLDQLARAQNQAADPKGERLALLINGYNALVVSEVCKGRTPESLFGRYRFFWRNRVEIARESITLWDLEHERIRPLGEPRIHFAIVCASASCPELHNEAFTANQLEGQLDDATRRFVNDRERNHLEPAGGVASLSKIFLWYEQDFVAAAPSVASFVSGYVDDPSAAQALLLDDLVVRYLPYDWSLNGPPPGAD